VLARFCAGKDDANKLRCMVVDRDMDGEEVKAAHIWPHSKGGEALLEFGLEPTDLHDARNGLLLCNAIEEAFDRKRVCFQYNGLDRTLRFLVLDPTLLEKVADGGKGSTTFGNLHGRLLQFPEDRPPFRRLLYAHAHFAMISAKGKNWSTEGSELLADLQMLSPGAKCPDMLKFLLGSRQESCALDDKATVEQMANPETTL
jgi:hypothetical protein